MTTRHSPSLPLSIIAASLLAATPVFAASDIVISQVYGGGGNTGATYKNDFIELFNRGSAPVSLNGWSVQYASATGSSWSNKTNLPDVILQPGQFLLIQQAAGSGGTASLPTPDATGSIALSGSNGKVALVASTTALSGTNPSSYIDLVGYGTANHYEGAAAPALSNTTAATRNNVCIDSDNNAADFAAVAPNPRNSGLPLAPCGGSTVNAVIVPSCPALTVDAGTTGSIAISATDSDSTVNAITAGALPAGITLDNVSPAAADGATASATLNVAAGTAIGNYSIPVSFANDDAQSASCTVSITIQAAAGITRIYDIQGNGNASPLTGSNVTTEGIVTAVFPSLSGYFLQDATGDGLADTSDGIFVYAPGASVSVGQKLRLTATVAEYNTVTELTYPSNVQLLGSGFNVTPTDIALPESVEGELERYEGMLVRITTPLTVSQNYFQGRYGQVTLSADGRLEIPTNRYQPGSPEALTQADENARRRIVLDDGSGAQNPNPIPFIGADNTLRAGDTVTDLTGVIDHGLITSNSSGARDYKLHPTITPTFTRDNPRTTAPANVGGNVKVASFNVLNYFTTFTDGATASGQTGQGCTLGGSTSASNCRGASNAAEFARQQAKIVAALKAINADIVGLMEIQNNGNVAVQNLVNALNTAYGRNVYAAVTNLNGPTGTDAIRVALIYKPATVTPDGAALADSNAIHNRPPLAQTFRAANGEKLSVVVNHFKSKSCSDASGADADQGDGQGCYNGRREQQAMALLGFVDTVKAQAGDSDVLVIGDLNSYGMENPIRRLTDAGLVNEIATRIAEPYSYTFDGESGYLDHALASTSLSAQLAGIADWHINTDEPSVIDYNTEFKPQDLYSATPYRSSDHDPVIVGINLLKRIDGTTGRDNLVGTAGDDIITGGIGADTLTGGPGADQFVYTSLRDAMDTITDFDPGVDVIVLTDLLRSLGITSGAPLADGYITCTVSGGNALIGIDPDASGAATARNVLLLKSRNCAELKAPDFRG